MLFGLPITEARMENGFVTQWFERARLEWHPEESPQYRVLGGRLGAEVSGR